MIPAFPKFRKVESADRKVVEAHTHQYPHYSDFNFTSLWAWDTNGERMISELHGNLVVQFTDYETSEPFLSFLGTHKVNETATALVEYATAHGLPTTLKLMPEASVQGLDTEKFVIHEDRDNFDYVYSIAELQELRGKKFETKRNMLSRFMRSHPHATVEHIDLKEVSSHSRIYEMLALWTTRKSGTLSASEHKLELHSIQKLLKGSSAHPLLGTVVTVNGECVAFNIDEILTKEYAIAHFTKADTARAGAYDFLMRAVVNRLAGEGVQFLNYEQDLGIVNLRASKSSFRPVHFLKKYTVSAR